MPRYTRSKKHLQAEEQQREDIVEARQAWAKLQATLDAERLIFLNETWATTNMTRTRGRAPRGERLVCAVPHGHWHTTTIQSGLRTTGLVAPLVLDGPINGAAFERLGAECGELTHRGDAGPKARWA